MIYITVNLSMPRPVLCCPSIIAFGLCCAAQIPWLQGTLSQIIVREDHAGSSLLVLVITLPVWPCLYLKVQKEVLMWTSFMNGIGFF